MGKWTVKPSECSWALFLCVGGNFEAGAALEVVDHSFGTVSTTMSIRSEMLSLRASKSWNGTWFPSEIEGKKTPQVVDLPPFHSDILLRGWKHKDRYQNFDILRTIPECIHREDKILRRETNLFRKVDAVMRAKSCARGVTWFAAMFASHFCTHSTNMVLGWKFSRFCKTISVKFHVLQVWCRFFERYFFLGIIIFLFLLLPLLLLLSLLPLLSLSLLLPLPCFPASGLHCFKCSNIYFAIVAA